MTRFAWLATVLAFAAPSRAAQPVTVRVVKTAGRYRLVRDGKPYFVKGVGGSTSMERAKAAGANSVRTWGGDNQGPTLDEAQRLGMTVTVGIWLGQERQGFNYSDPKQVADQYANVRRLVEKYKDYPALLMWGIGNEMEGDGRNPAIWTEVNGLAALVKKLDPRHPVMTVVAELGDAKIPNFDKLCPNVDVLGINSYAGGPSLAERYKKAGEERPYIVTEFGPPGSWESAKTPWNAAVELTSTAKATVYRNTYERSIAGQPKCLGSYAFLWGNKQEATATWFGMLLPDGSKLGAVDAMTQLWSGKPPTNLCPVISSLRFVGGGQAVAGATIHAALEVSDPENDALHSEWMLQAEPKQHSTGGDDEKAPPTFPEATVHSDASGADVRVPETLGSYRLFVTVRDGKGGAATANLPLLVKQPSGSAP